MRDSCASPGHGGELLFAVVEESVSRVKDDTRFRSFTNQATCPLSQDQATDPVQDQIYLAMI